MIETDPDTAIAVIKATKRTLSARPEGFDDPAFRGWFAQIGAMKFFSLPPPASASVEEIARATGRGIWQIAGGAQWTLRRSPARNIPCHAFRTATTSPQSPERRMLIRQRRCAGSPTALIRMGAQRGRWRDWKGDQRGKSRRLEALIMSATCASSDCPRRITKLCHLW